MNAETTDSEQKPPAQSSAQPPAAEQPINKLAYLKNQGQLIRAGLDFAHVRNPEDFLKVFKDASRQAEEVVEKLHPEYKRDAHEPVD